MDVGRKFTTTAADAEEPVADREAGLDAGLAERRVPLLVEHPARVGLRLHRSGDAMLEGVGLARPSTDALDSTVQLRFRYGTNGRFSLQRSLIGLLAPKPLASFYLDIPPETSLDRKDDRWTLADLDTQARLYREEYGRDGAVRLDGLRPRDELAAEIGETAWRALA